jgi:hypothetical protein
LPQGAGRLGVTVQLDTAAGGAPRAGLAVDLSP